MFTRTFDRRVYLTLGVLVASGVIFVAFGVYANWPSNREAGYMPPQPMAYSHKTHAGTLKIDCLYCHTNATKGPNASVPPLSTCMNCHNEVQPKGKDGKLKPDIKLLLEHWKQGKPIRWNKVHVLADFVFFDHSRHMADGTIRCQECHGPVETFEHMKRQYGLKMSWCLDCHKQEVKKKDLRGREVTTTRAPIHCSTCHR